MISRLPGISLLIVVALGLTANCKPRHKSGDNAAPAAAAAAPAANATPATGPGVYLFSMQNAIGMSLANTIGAWVKTVRVTCPDNYSYTITLADADHQSFDALRDLSNCTFVMQSFVANALAGLPMPTMTYNIGQTGITLSNGTIVAAFDALNDQNALVDRRLVNNTVAISAAGCPGAATSCNFKNIAVQFSYSQVAANDVQAVGNLTVSTTSLGMEIEPPPTCTATAAWQTPSADQATDLSQLKLHVTLSGCTQLAATKIVEYGWHRHWWNNVYQVSNAPGDAANIIGMMEVIAAANKNFTFANAPIDIYLTLDEIKTLTRTTTAMTTMTALREDLVLAIRNNGGKSLSYFVIHNSCNTELAQIMTDKIKSIGSNISWTQTWIQPYLSQNPTLPASLWGGLWTITGLNLGSGPQNFDDFCIDTQRDSPGNATSYQGTMVSSYDLNTIYSQGLVQHPAALPMVNYALNKYYNSNAMVNNVAVTWSDLQEAIWTLAEAVVPANGGGGILAINPDTVKAIVDDAKAHGASYSPTCAASSYFAALLVPRGMTTTDGQITFIVVKPGDLGVTFCR